MINLTDNFNLNKPAHLDARVGPWESVNDATANVPFDQREIGLTIVVFDGSMAEEYWWKDGLTNGDLVVKSTGGGGVVAWGSITGTLSNQTDLNTALTGIQSDISTIQTDITGIQSDISTIDSSIASINANAVFDGDTAGGDLTGTFPNPVVSKIHGIDVQSGNPNHGDFLVFENGANHKWNHRPIESTDVPNLDASKITTGTFANQRMAKVSRPMILQSSPSQAGNTTSEVVLQTLTIPANSLSVGDVFRICGLLTYTTTGTKQPRVRFGNSASGTPIIFQQASISASVTSNQFEFLAVVTNSTTLRFPLNSIAGLVGYGNNTGALQTATIDLTQPISISITIQKTTGSDTTTLETSWIEILTQ
jgi:hypothetical protein